MFLKGHRESEWGRGTERVNGVRGTERVNGVRAGRRAQEASGAARAWKTTRVVKINRSLPRPRARHAPHPARTRTVRLLHVADGALVEGRGVSD